MYSGFTLYNNGGASRTKIGDTHERFVREIEQKHEEKLSRTQELNAVKMQALKELGYTTITADNAKEVFEKIAEIQSRNVQEGQKGRVMFILDEYQNTWNYTFIIVAIIAILIGAGLEYRRSKKAKLKKRNKN